MDKRTVSRIRINGFLSTAFCNVRQRPSPCTDKSARLIRKRHDHAHNFAIASPGRGSRHGSGRMMSISASAISETLDHAFRAALLLTGSAGLAEKAVLDGIAGLESGDNLEKALVAKTIESVIRQRADFPNQLEHTLERVPHEIQRLMLLAPVSRDCFILRILFGVTPANCARILNLTIEEFEESLYAAFQQLSMLGAPICSPGPMHETKGAQQ